MVRSLRSPAVAVLVYQSREPVFPARPHTPGFFSDNLNPWLFIGTFPRRSHHSPLRSYVHQYSTVPSSRTSNLFKCQFLFEDFFRFSWSLVLRRTVKKLYVGRHSLYLFGRIFRYRSTRPWFINFRQNERWEGSHRQVKESHLLPFRSRERPERSQSLVLNVSTGPRWCSCINPRSWRTLKSFVSIFQESLPPTSYVLTEAHGTPGVVPSWTQENEVE